MTKRLTEAERAILSEKEKKYDFRASAQDCIHDLRILQETFTLKYITRNFYRINGKYSDATWNKFFGTFHEFRRQAGLELSRHQHTLEKQIAKHASLDVYRRFYREEILPYHCKHEWTHKQKSRYKTVVVASDFHDIDTDPFCLSVFLDTIQRIQPHVVCLNGDVFDNPSFSRHSIDIRDYKITERFNFVKKSIFGGIRKACPDSQIDFILGNHDLYIIRALADQTPAIRVILSDVMGLSLKDVFGLDEFKINLIAKLDLGVFNKKDLKQNYKIYYDSFVAHHYEDLGFGLSGTNGHTHRPKQSTFRNHPMGHLIWTNTGAMRKNDADYIIGYSQWMNSFLVATIDTHTKQVIHNHVVIQKDFALFEGKLYLRND